MIKKEKEPNIDNLKFRFVFVCLFFLFSQERDENVNIKII